MIYYAHCKACGSRWQVVPPPNQHLDLFSSLSLMERGTCPDCRNDGTKAPVNWKFTFGGEKEPNYGQVRRKERPAP